jgi:hypothetical protein
MATNENPTYLDVQREVKRLYITKPDEPTDAATSNIGSTWRR